MRTLPLLRPGLALLALACVACQSSPTSLENKTLDGLTLSDVSGAHEGGTSFKVTATASYSDGTHEDVSAKATWQSSDLSVATVQGGTVSALSAGTTKLSAAFDGKTASATVTISSAALSSIAITPAGPLSLTTGATQQLSVTATYDDATTVDVTDQVTWAVDTSNVTVSASGLLSAVSPGAATVTAQFGAQSTGVQVTVQPPALTALTIAPEGPLSLAKGAAQQLTVTATYSNGSTADVTAQVHWSLDSGAVTVDAAGLLTAASEGSANVTASLAGVTSTPLAVQITPAVVVSLAVTPTGPITLAKGLTQQLTATATYTDSSTAEVTTQVTWSVDSSAATVDAAGLLTANSEGSANVTASLAGVTSAPVAVQVTPAAVVSLAITPTGPITVHKGLTQQLTATATYTDSTTADLTSQVSWSVDSAAATVDAAGLLTATAEGSANIIASLAGVTSAPVSVQVTAAVASLAITPAGPISLAKGLTQQLTVTATFTDSSTADVTSQITWSVDTAAATVDATGLLTAAAEGPAVVTATLGGVPTSVDVTVGPAQPVSLEISAQALLLPPSVQEPLHATEHLSDGTTLDVTSTATWTSSDESIATATGGTLQTLATGDVTVTAQADGVSGSVAVAVKTLSSLLVHPRLTVTLRPQATQALSAIGTFSDGTTQDLTSWTTWSTSAAQIATVDTNGVVTAVGPGRATVTGAVGAITDAITISVQAPSSLAVSPAAPQIAVSTALQLQALAAVNNGLTYDASALATWTTSDPTIATVNAGELDAIAPGTATISCNYWGFTVSVTVTVTAAQLQSLEVFPRALRAVRGTQHPVKVLGHFDDGTTQDLTGQVSWSTSDASVATVSSTAVTVLGAPETTASVTASWPASGLTAALPVSVVPAPLVFVGGSDGVITTLGYGADGLLSVTSTFALPAAMPNAVVDATGQYFYAASTATSFEQLALSADGVASALAPELVTFSADTHWLTEDPFGRFLYALDTVHSLVSPFSIGSDGTLTDLGASVASGSATQRVITSRDGRFAYVSNWSSRTVQQLAIALDGTLSTLAAPINLGLHTQGMTMNTAGSQLYVLSKYDTGNNLEVLTLKADGTLDAIQAFAVTSGGVTQVPQVIALNEAMHVAYVATGNGFIQFRINEDGSLEDLNADVAGDGQIFAMVVSPDGSRLDVADGNVVHQYAIGANGIVDGSTDTPLTFGSGVALRTLQTNGWGAPAN